MDKALRCLVPAAVLAIALGAGPTWWSSAAYAAPATLSADTANTMRDLLVELGRMRASTIAQQKRLDQQQARIDGLQRRMEMQARADADRPALALLQAPSPVVQPPALAPVIAAPYPVTPADRTAASLGTQMPLLAGLDLHLFGRADIAATASNGYNAEDKSVTTFRANEGEMTSRIGLIGAYTLNLDWKAVFALEGGINLFNGNIGGTVNNTATSPVIFNRGSTAGIVSKTYGSLEAGLMYLPTFWVLLLGDQASADGLGISDQSALIAVSRVDALGLYLKNPPLSATEDFSKSTSQAGGYSGTTGVYSDSFRYRTPKFDGLLAGLSAEVAMSLGQQAFTATPNANDGRTLGFNVLYTHGNFYIGYGYQDYQQEADLATAKAKASLFVGRRDVTNIVGSRYKLGNFEVGATYTDFAVSNAGGYDATAFGLSSAYTIDENRLELSLGHTSFAGANTLGAYGLGTGDRYGEPISNALGVSYLRNIRPRLVYYLSYQVVWNNRYAKLGVIDFRSDNASFGKRPSEVSSGMFYTF